MDRNRLHIGKRFSLKKYLSGKDRQGHLLLRPSDGINTLRFWSHLLRMEAVQTCSSIIFTCDPDRASRIEAIQTKGKLLLHLDPDRPDSLALNPLFHSDERTALWFVNFFFDREDSNESALKAREILKCFIQLVAVNDPAKRTTLPDIYQQAGLGIRTLKERLRFQGRFGHLALLKQINSLCKNDQVEVLREIHHRLSLFQEIRITMLFSRPTVYAPLYTHEPTVLIVSIPENGEADKRVMHLALLSIVHQIVDFPNHRPTLPLCLHLDGCNPLSLTLMNALKECSVGLTCLSKQAESDDGFDIHIKTGKRFSQLTRRGKETVRFRPALDRSLDN